MPELRTADGRYLFADQGDGNAVVYDPSGVAVWDRWSWEAGHQVTLPPAAKPPGPPASAEPIPSAGAGRVIRVTTDADGAFAPRMMSDRANAWVRGNTAYVFAGSLMYGCPEFFEVDLASEAIVRRGPMLPYSGETEGWAWLPDGRLLVLDGPRIRLAAPFTTGEDRVVLDIRERNPGWDLWQPHVSDDGETLSATVRDTVNTLPGGKYPNIGTVTIHHRQEDYWPAKGVLDESQVSRNGKWIVIKEDRGSGDDNRVINFDSRETTWLPDQGRAIGHSDCGPDYVIGEADKPDPGACVIWYLDRLNEGPRILFHTTNMGYVSARAGRCLWSGPTHLALVALDGSGVTPLIEHGGGSAYDDRVKSNLSPCGRVACYMRGGSVYLLVI